MTSIKSIENGSVTNSGPGNATEKGLHKEGCVTVENNNDMKNGCVNVEDHKKKTTSSADETGSENKLEDVNSKPGAAEPSVENESVVVQGFHNGIEQSTDNSLSSSNDEQNGSTSREIKNKTESLITVSPSPSNHHLQSKNTIDGMASGMNIDITHNNIEVETFENNKTKKGGNSSQITGSEDDEKSTKTSATHSKRRKRLEGIMNSIGERSSTTPLTINNEKHGGKNTENKDGTITVNAFEEQSEKIDERMAVMNNKSRKSQLDDILDQTTDALSSSQTESESGSGEKEEFSLSNEDTTDVATTKVAASMNGIECSEDVNDLKDSGRNYILIH